MMKGANLIIISLVLTLLFRHSVEVKRFLWHNFEGRATIIKLPRPRFPLLDYHLGFGMAKITWTIFRFLFVSLFITPKTQMTKTSHVTFFLKIISSNA